MNCPNCRSENPEDANFCARCGTALSPAGISVERAVQEFERKITAIETKALDGFQEKVTHRVKRMAGPALAFLTFVLAGFGFLGYRSFQALLTEATQDIQRKKSEADKATQEVLEETRKRVESVRAEIAAQTQDISRDMEAVRADLQSARLKGETEKQEMEKAGRALAEITTELKSKLGEMHETEHKIGRMETRIADYEKTIRQDSEKVRGLKNSVFEVYIRCGRQGAWSKPCPLFSRKLSEAGFSGVTEPDFDTAVDKSEVVYYHPSAENQAEDVAKLLAEYLEVSRVPTRHEKRADAEARHVLLVKILGY